MKLLHLWPWIKLPNDFFHFLIFGILLKIHYCGLVDKHPVLLKIMVMWQRGALSFFLFFTHAHIVYLLSKKFRQIHERKTNVWRLLGNQSFYKMFKHKIDKSEQRDVKQLLCATFWSIWLDSSEIGVFGGVSCTTTTNRKSWSITY